MNRIKYTNTCDVDGINVSIESLETLQYDGRWMSNGFNIRINNTTVHLYGYPTDSDIRNNFPEVFSHK